MSRREIFKGKLKDLENNVKSRKAVLMRINEIHNHWEQIEDYFFLKKELNEMNSQSD